jgi:riboflavin biosynthesis pyrimidine reductase
LNRQGFEELGQWRLSAGYKGRSPDLVIVTRGLDFEFPEGVMRSGRRIMVFTTYAQAGSDQAKALTASGVVVVGSGETGVEGNRMIDYLSDGLGYRVIMMATGPSVLEILLKAKRLDRIYITEAQLEISFDDASTVQTILPGGRKVSELKEFRVTHQYLQEDVVTRNGSLISQLFVRYDRTLNGQRLRVFSTQVWSPRRHAFFRQTTPATSASPTTTRPAIGTAGPLSPSPEVTQRHHIRLEGDPRNRAFASHASLTVKGRYIWGLRHGVASCTAVDHSPRAGVVVVTPTSSGGVQSAQATRRGEKVS